MNKILVTESLTQELAAELFEMHSLLNQHYISPDTQADIVNETVDRLLEILEIT